METSVSEIVNQIIITMVVINIGKINGIIVRVIYILYRVSAYFI